MIRTPSQITLLAELPPPPRMEIGTSCLRATVTQATTSVGPRTLRVQCRPLVAHPIPYFARGLVFRVIGHESAAFFCSRFQNHSGGAALRCVVVLRWLITKAPSQLASSLS
jgi:hypothetical protein